MATAATADQLYRQMSEGSGRRRTSTPATTSSPTTTATIRPSSNRFGAPRGIGRWREGASIVDGHIRIDQFLSFDDYVVARWTRTGTHVGRMGAIEPTGEEVTITGIDINRFEDGKLAETRFEVDFLSMLVQVGELSEGIFAPPEATEG